MIYFVQPKLFCIDKEFSFPSTYYFEKKEKKFKFSKNSILAHSLF